MHGPDTLLNKKPVCPTGHDNIHLYIDWLLTTAIAGEHETVRLLGAYRLQAVKVEPQVTRSEKSMALEGYRRWVDMGHPALLAKEAS
jgi:hypothetical protein